jgi:hypothetical protein
MSLWTRAQGFRQGVPCSDCRQGQATRRCDGVLQGRTPWTVCLKPMCEGCLVRHGAAEFCRHCAVVRGLVTRDAGEEG